MCGRYALYTPPEMFKSKYVLENILNLPARYNCAPMQELPVIVKNRMGFARWGFRPEWAKQDDKAMAVKMINARSETVAEKPSFRESWARKRRCLVPMDGFYEWHTDEGGTKAPYFIQGKDKGPLLVAGLWSKVEGQISFTILTKPADGDIAKLHRRMPVIIRDVSGWFEGNGNLIEQATAADLTCHRVDNRVGKVAEDDAGLIEVLAA